MFDFLEKSRFLQRFEPAAPSRHADSFTRVRWLRQWIRPYATDLAAWEYCGADFVGWDTLPVPEAECLLASVQIAERYELPREEAITAARAEWKTAQARVQKFADDLRRAIWRLGREHAPGAQILAEAGAVNDRHGVILPTELLHGAARRIAHAAGGRRHAVR